MLPGRQLGHDRVDERSSAAATGALSSVPSAVEAGWTPCSTSCSGQAPLSCAAPSRSARPTSCGVMPERERARPLLAVAAAPASPAGAPVSIASTMIARRASARCGSSSSPAVPPSISSTPSPSACARAAAHGVHAESVVGEHDVAEADHDAGRSLPAVVRSSAARRGSSRGSSPSSTLAL